LVKDTYYSIFGSSGLVGCHLLNLLKDKKNVRIKAFYNKRKPQIKSKNISFIKLNILNAKSLVTYLQDQDYVINVSGIVCPSRKLISDPINPVFENLNIFSKIIKSAYQAKVKKFLWLSSTTGYPSRRNELREELMFTGNPPDFWYGLGWMIRYCESLCKYLNNLSQNKMKIIVLRPTMIYGDYYDFKKKHQHFFGDFIKQIVERKKLITVYGNGADKRNLIYAGDVAALILESLRKINTYETVNIRNTRSFSILQYLEIIMKIENYFPKVICKNLNKEKIDEKKISLRKANKYFNMKNLVNITDGTQKTINWFKSTQ
jgi:GDP-L-fucose synthase